MTSAVVRWYRSGLRRTVGAMTSYDEATVEAQDLVDQLTGLVSIVDHDGVDAGVDLEDLEVQVGDTAQAFSEVSTQRVLAANRAVTGIEELRGDRRPEHHINGEVAHDPL